MKPAPFEYVRPASITELCAILAEDENARIIAGGQTLVPMLAMRLSRPSKLVDIMRLQEMGGIRRDDNHLIIGATMRQAEAEHSPLVASDAPLLRAVLPWVGHPPTRNRGTIGGSIANADPSAEIPLVAVTLEAEFVLAEKDEESIVGSDEFFIGAMITTLPQSACLKAIRFPVWSDARVGVGFHEVSSRRSDFAFAAAAAQLALDSAGRCTRLALGLGGVGERPSRLDVGALLGSRLAEPEVQKVVHEACQTLEAVSDLHASAGYRLRLASALGTRAIATALARARGEAA